ncbi:prephenate dehydrogenase (NADP(+)) [Lobulomyces angularis]|nr:prephenate dehydrogenase (NADP(+)) [Lobulomyces angularis]
MIQVGIIGLGDMGKLYALTFAQAGYKVNVCDLPSKYKALKSSWNIDNIKVYKNGHCVSRISDFTIYCVEASAILNCVKEYGPSTKANSIVAGQTSVKEPEILAFEKFLPEDVNIVTCHSLHGPNVSPKNQTLVIIRQRSDQKSFEIAVEVLKSLKSKIVYLSYLEHDRITANTQACTHLAFLSMGTAWMKMKNYPWENKLYLGGIENIKILITLRILNANWHVYGGLAILNPAAQLQILQFEKSCSELFKLMLLEKKNEFKKRIMEAKIFIFGGNFGNKNVKSILLSDEILNLNKFSLSAIPKDQRKQNSQLSLLAMADTWYQLRINPYDHLVCQTPPFALMLGCVEYLFHDKEMLEDAINAAIFDKEIRADDLEFVSGVRGWCEIVGLGSMQGYKKRFENVKTFFKDRLEEGKKASTELIGILANISANKTSKL